MIIIFISTQLLIFSIDIYITHEVHVVCSDERTGLCRGLMAYPRMHIAPNNANQIKSNIEIQNDNMITRLCNILQYTTIFTPVKIIIFR